MKVAFKLLRCSLSSAKVMQIERNESYFQIAEMQLIFCKGMKKKV